MFRKPFDRGECVITLAFYCAVVSSVKALSAYRIPLYRSLPFHVDARSWTKEEGGRHTSLTHRPAFHFRCTGTVNPLPEGTERNDAGRQPEVRG
jgi:hypothetical protein